jgi:hypothetical protein
MPALDLTTAIVGALLVGLWLSFIAYFATDAWWRPALHRQGGGHRPTGADCSSARGADRRRALGRGAPD